MELVLLTIQRLFPAVLRMSLSAAFLVPVVLALRLLLRNAPKWTRCLLWLLVAIRLMFPLLPESDVSLMPRPGVSASSEARAITAALDGNLPALEFETPRDRAINQAAEQAGRSVRIGSSAAPSEYLPFAWAGGALAMLLYALISWLRLKRRVAASLPVKDNALICDDIDSPFILGVFRPRIYLPSSLREPQLAHVLSHERAHIARRDHWWRPLGFLLLSLHWFNPLLWLSYLLLCRDLELACDERAVRDMDASARADYSAALLELSRNRSVMAAGPLAFGETGVKQRVKSVLNYRKPAFWLVAAAVAVFLLAALCFLTDPAAVLPADGEIVSGEYAAVSSHIALPPEAWAELEALIGSHRARRFPVGADDPGILSRSVSLQYADGSFLLVHSQYYSGFSFRRGREDDYRTVVTCFDAGGKGRKAWRMEDAFDDAFSDWRNRWISGEENALDLLWRQYRVESVLYDLGREEAWTDVRSCAVNEDHELLVSVGEAGEWRRIGSLEPFTPEKSSFDGRYGYYGGYDSAAALRKRNRMAWRAVTKDAPDARFYDLFLQMNGEFLLGAGYYDAGEAGDPYSDDGRVYRVFRLAGTLEDPSEEVPDEDALREKYPEYFGLSAFKGLELYVWQLGPGVLRCGLMEGTNRNKTSEEICGLKGATTDEMKLILSTYDIPEEDIFILPFLHPASSYIYEINEEYRGQLRELFFGSAAIAAAPLPGEQGEPDSAGVPVLTLICGGISIVPYLHGRNSLTWDGNHWLAADGIPAESDIREHADEIPILILDGELTLTLGEDVRRSDPMLQVYDMELARLFRRDEQSLDALYELKPGEYFCTLGVYQWGRYIAAEEQYEGSGYDCVFRLWVPETGDEGK